MIELTSSTTHTSVYHKNLFYLWHFRKVIVFKLQTFQLNKYLNKVCYTDVKKEPAKALKLWQFYFN